MILNLSLKNFKLSTEQLSNFKRLFKCEQLISVLIILNTVKYFNSIDVKFF